MSAMGGCGPALDMMRSGDLDMLSTLLQPQAAGSGLDAAQVGESQMRAGGSGMAQQPSWPLVPQQPSAFSTDVPAAADAWRDSPQQLRRQSGSLHTDWGGSGLQCAPPHPAAAPSPFMQQQGQQLGMDVTSSDSGAFPTALDTRPPGHGRLVTRSAEMTMWRQPPPLQHGSLRTLSAADAIVPQLDAPLQAPKASRQPRSKRPSVPAPPCVLAAADEGPNAGPKRRQASPEPLRRASESASSGGQSMQLRRRSAPAIAKYDAAAAAAAAAKVKCEFSPEMGPADAADAQPPAKKRLGRPVKDPRSSRDPGLTTEERRRLMRREANRASARRVRQRKQESCQEIQERIELAMDQQEDIISRLNAAQDDVTRLQRELDSTTEAFKSHTEQAARLRMEMASMQNGPAYQYGRGVAPQMDQRPDSWQSYPVQRVSSPIETGQLPWPQQ